MGILKMFRKICFVGTDTYPVLNPSIGKAYTGGESVQLTLLAKAFAELGYEVTMVDKDYGQPDGQIFDGIKVLKTFAENSGLPVFRFLYPRITSIFRALKRADADIYYQSCAGMLTGVVASFCMRYKRKFIFRTASDSDCIGGKQLIRFWRDRKLYEYGLKRADLIAVQSVKQQLLLKKYYDLDGIPVNMAVELPKDDISVDKGIDVLWISNFRPLKRAELLIQLAENLPTKKFVMIGGPCPGYSSYYTDIKGKAENVKNIEFVGPLPYNEVNKFFLRAYVFINTSSIEGYPNTFLQAWIRGVPVVSFFDPDDLIATKSLGFVPSNLKDMERNILNLLTDETKRMAMAEKARTFATEYYSTINVTNKYIQLLEEFDK